MDLNWLVYPVAFMVTLGIVATIHEFGHFIVARLAGVKVIRFAVGFGKPLTSWFDRRGTEFCVCAIPLGGYVRLLDSRQDDIAPEDQSGDLSSKSVSARIAIYAAGPLINIIFAIFVFCVYAMLGVTEVRPIVGLTESESSAEIAGLMPGDEIIEVAGRSVQSWEETSFQFIESAGLTGQLFLKVERQENAQSKTYPLELQVNEFMADTAVSPLEELGIVPQIHLVKPVLGLVSPDKPAALAGWQEGDVILRLNGEPVQYWRDVYTTIRANPDQSIPFELERQGDVISGTIRPELIQLEKSETIGRVGAGPQQYELDDDLVRHVQYGPFAAIGYGFEQTWVRTRLVVLAIGKLITGALGLENVTGPVTIAEMAGKTAQIGVSSSLNFLAYLSISLGVFNLLPVPLLDGGHIVFALYEAVRGKPASMLAQQRAMTVGFAMLGSLMVLALFNDLVRLFSSM